MASPIRLAILECDTPLTKTREKYGGYGGLFTALMYAAADALSKPHGELDISEWDVVNKMDTYPSLDEIDAILITGSRFNAFDDDEWVVRLVDFVKKILAQDKVRVIGVCYGHQIVGRALGAKVARSEGGAWEASVCDVRLTSKGKDLFRKDVLNIFQMHKDVVCDYPKGVEELGWSDSCEVQGMYIPKRVITVQGHPEFTEEVVRELLKARREQNIFDENIYKDAMARVVRPHDGVLVAQAFLRFLLEQ